MTFMASQGLLDNKTVLQLSAVNSKIVTRLVRHNALKREMDSNFKGKQLEHDRRLRVIEDFTEASLRALSAIVLAENQEQYVGAAMWLMQYIAKDYRTTQEAAVLKAEYDELRAQESD